MQWPHHDLCTAWPLAKCSSNSWAVGVFTLRATLGLRASTGASPGSSAESAGAPGFSPSNGLTAKHAVSFPTSFRFRFVHLWPFDLPSNQTRKLLFQFSNPLTCNLLPVTPSQHMLESSLPLYFHWGSFYLLLLPKLQSSSCTLQRHLPRYGEHPLSIGDWIQSIGSSKGIHHFFKKILFFIDFGYWFFCVWNWFCNWFCNWFFGIDFLRFFGGSLWVRFCSHLATQTAKTNAYHPQSHALSIHFTMNKKQAICTQSIFSLE